MSGWTATEYLLLALLAPLLVASAFFSGSETALFGLTGSERMNLRQSRSYGARTALGLVESPRMLLITILLGNMAANVLYFVISSVLMMQTDGVLANLGLAVGSLLALVLLGEVLPKMVANHDRVKVASLVAPLIDLVHRAISPLRIALNVAVVTPLSRLTSPPERPPDLSAGELEALLEVSEEQGVIDADEEQTLREVLELSRLRVRNVMTPRVRTVAVDRTDSRETIRALAESSRFTKLPVYEGDLDSIVGLLHVKRFLLDDANTPIDRMMTDAGFVPEMATLDQLLEHFRRSQTDLAIVVDEYGGTSGVVALKDVVEEIVGEISRTSQMTGSHAMFIALNTWRISGDMGVHDWAESFSQPLDSPRVSTIGGLLVQHLGRGPSVGDTVRIGDLLHTIEEVDGTRVAWITVQRVNEEDENPGPTDAEDQI